MNEPIRGRRERNRNDVNKWMGERNAPLMVKNTYPRLRLVSDDELENIHLKSLEVLEETGMEVLLPEAREYLRKAGLASAKADRDLVKFDRNFILDHIKHAPREFTLHARNPLRNVNIGGDNLVFASVASAPYAGDSVGGRRRGNHEDYRKFLKLVQSFGILHTNSGYPCEPTDIPPNLRHLECIRDQLLLTDKVAKCYVLGKYRNLDAIEMVRIARGVSTEQLHREPSLLTVVNTNSPLKLDNPMSKGIIEMAKAGQVSIITPFTLAGAMAPVTIAGALVLQNAEALVGITLSQVVKKGAPIMYGGFTSTVDMKSGAPSFGTPGHMQATVVGGQLARRYGFPYRSSNTNASCAVDSQSAYESVFSLWAAIMGGCNYMLHSAGWLEGGLVANFEKFMIDVDNLYMVADFLKPFAMQDDDYGKEAIADVGPGGHFFGTMHTQSRYKNAFYSPMISDWRNIGQWTEAGSPNALTRAGELYPKFLEMYEQPAIDQAISDELNEYVAKRIEEGGADDRVI